MKSSWNVISKKVSFPWMCRLLFLGVVAWPASTALSQQGTALSQAQKKPDPCCTITGFDAGTGIVTARVQATGQEFQFKVTNASQLNALTVGQGVYANFAKKQVSLDGSTACCRIIDGLPTGGSLPIEPRTPARPPQTSPQDRPPGAPGTADRGKPTGVPPIEIEIPRVDPAGRRAIVIVVEENQAQANSVHTAAVFQAVDGVLSMGLNDLGINLPRELERALANIKGLRGQLLQDIRNGYRSMLRQASYVDTGSSQVNCFKDAMLAFSNSFAIGPKPGKIFLDRWGEAAIGNCLRDMARPYYDAVVLLTDQEATFSTFRNSLLKLNEQGYSIDVLLDVHGCGKTNNNLNNRRCGSDLLVFTNEPATPAMVTRIKDMNGGQPLNLNLVYMVSCWGSQFNKTWTDIGAKESNGSQELNYYVLASPLLFMHYFTAERLSLEDAANKAYSRERRILNGQDFSISFGWRDPLTRKKHTVGRIPIGITWSRLINRALAKNYGEDTNRPVNNESSSVRQHLRTQSAATRIAPFKDSKTGSGQVKVPATTVTVSEPPTTSIAIRGRPAADHPGTDREPAPAGGKTESSFPPPLGESVPTRQGGVPDVTAHIRQDIMDYGTRYRAKITLENRGSALMPQVKVNTYGVPNHHIAGKTPPSLEECMSNPLISCIRHKTTVGPLAPGQKQAFHAGGKQPRTTTLYVHVIIECGTPGPGGQPQCGESNTENNKVNRVLGPH